MPRFFKALMFDYFKPHLGIYDPRPNAGNHRRNSWYIKRFMAAQGPQNSPHSSSQSRIRQRVCTFLNIYICNWTFSSAHNFTVHSCGYLPPNSCDRSAELAKIRANLPPSLQFWKVTEYWTTFGMRQLASVRHRVTMTREMEICPKNLSAFSLQSIRSASSWSWIKSDARQIF